MLQYLPASNGYNYWAVSTTKAHQIHKVRNLRGHMHCCEAEEVPMRLVGDTQLMLCCLSEFLFHVTPNGAQGWHRGRLDAL
jgi:hypothetical protein